MERDLQTLLHDALLNNSYDYDSMHKTLDKTLKSSYSYLYTLQKALIEYEELFRYSGESTTRDFEKIGHLYLDDYNFACFDIDYDIIVDTAREKYRRSDYYQIFNHFNDLIDNPDIFQKIPIVIIDDKTIWDYEIRITKDGMTFKLPYRENFVYEKYRNKDAETSYIYIDHKIQVLIVDNCYYQRVGTETSLSPYAILDGKNLSISKSLLDKVNYYEIYNMDGSKTDRERMTPTEFDHSYRSTSTEITMAVQIPEGKTLEVKGYKIKISDTDYFARPIYETLPDENHGTMFVTIHFPVDSTYTYTMPKKAIIDKWIKLTGHDILKPISVEEVIRDIEDIEYETITINLPKGFELGTNVIPLTDNGSKYTAPLSDALYNKLTSYGHYIYISTCFIENLKSHILYTNTNINEVTSSEDSGKILVLEKPRTVITDITSTKPGSELYCKVKSTGETFYGILKVNTKGEFYIWYNSTSYQIDDLIIYTDVIQPYNMPIPVENFMVFKQSSTAEDYILEKNSDMVELHYPNIYKIKDSTKAVGDKYKMYYFYKDDPGVKFTTLSHFYFKFIQDIFYPCSTEEVINKIYYKNYDDIKIKYGWDNEQSTALYNLFTAMYNYEHHIYKYGDIDFLDRYLQITGNENKTPIEYKDETLKEWITWEPDALHNYVLDQNKLGTSYHLFTNQIDLSTRIRYNADLECGNRTKKFINMATDFLTATLDVWEYVGLTPYRYYDEDGEYYILNSSTGYYEKKGQIGLHKLEEMIKANPGLFNKNTITLGTGVNRITPNSNLAYVDKTSKLSYRWDGDNFVEFTETHEFAEPRYVFSLNNIREYPTLLDIRVFIDGLILTDIYHDRRLFMDYIYIPCSMVTDDSYIEIEMFPNYSFTMDMQFNSLDEYQIITLVEPEEVIFPTLADVFIEDRNGDYPVRISKEFFDFTVITNGKDTAYYEVSEDAISGYVLTEAELNVRVAEGTLTPKLLPDDSYIYMDIKNIIYKYWKTEDDIRYYHGYAENVYYYVLKKHKWTKYNLNGDVIKTDIPEENVDYKNMKKGKAKLYLEPKDLHEYFDPSTGETVSPYPVRFPRISMIKVKPNDISMLNTRLKFKINKNPQGIPLVVDKQGYPFLEITGKNFNFSNDYLRVFVNGRILPKSKYNFYSTMFCPRLMIYEWLEVGDVIYLDVTPYRYTQVFYTEEIAKDTTTIELKKYINKPFDIRYYDVYMNGRKLSLNNVFSVSESEITLCNLHSQYHLTIFERERDWEWYGLDYTTNVYAFSLDSLFDFKCVSQDYKNTLLKYIIDKQKDYRLNIVPNEFTEEKMDYDTDVDPNTDFFVFYYYELVPKQYQLPDVKQISTEVMLENFPDVYNAYNTNCYIQSDDETQKERRKDYTPILFLDPDKIVEGRIGYFDSTMGYYKYHDSLKTYVYFSKDGVIDRSNTKTKEEIDALVTSGDLIPGNVTLTYVIGHPDTEVLQELLDQSSSVILPTQEDITK